MGRVYLSYTPGGRPVAIKVIRAEYADDPGFRRRFEQEVVTAQRVQGLYTAPVIDANTHALQPWLATAYVAGPSLQQAVGVYGPLPEESVLVLVAGVAEALQSIHGADVVHRDLKPSNVILAADGPRVIDFGIARAVDTTSVTQTGLRVGTPAFMAPEQVRGRPATPAVDLFALGALACYAATGELPFGGGLDPLVPHRILEEEPDLAACPERLRDLVIRCLAKDPRQRPSPTQVIDLCRQLSTGTRLQMGQGWLPPSVAAVVNRIATAPVPPAPADPKLPTKRRRRLVALAITSFVMVAAAAGITAAALSGAFRTTAASSAEPGPSTAGGQKSTFTDPTSARSETPLSESSGPAEQDTPTSQDPSEAPLPPFAPSNEKVRSGGEATLRLDRSPHLLLMDWGVYTSAGVPEIINASPADRVVFTEAGLAGEDGAQFGILEEGADTSFATCRDHTRWTPSITWGEAQRGSFACLRTSDGRRGIIRIDLMPKFNNDDDDDPLAEPEEPFTQLTGNIWQPIVDE